MDPDGNYEGRLSYTTITSSDNKVDALTDASKNPAYTESEDKRGGLDASAPPLSQLSIVANGEVCKTSPAVKGEAKNLSPPDEPTCTLNSVVVPIGPGTADTIPVARPIVTSARGAGSGVELPESPGNSQPPSGERLLDKNKTAASTRVCPTKKILFICLTLIVLAGVAAGVTIYLLPDQTPEEEGPTHMTLHDFYPNCHVPNENWVGNGKCDGLPYNTEVCGWDGGDCPPKTGGGQGSVGDAKIRNDGSDGGDDDSNNGPVDPDASLKIGNDEEADDDDDDDDDKDGATEATESDEDPPTSTVGDVLNDPNEIEAKASIYPECGVRDISKLGDAHCDKGVFNTAVCGWDGGDCLKEEWPDCDITDPISLQALGNGICNGSLDRLECGFDLGDCKADMNVDKLKHIVNNYPGCYFEGMEVEDFSDGSCDDWGDWNYNTEVCGYDGGDCILEDYPDCHVEDGWYVGDGDCDGGVHNTEECGWDGGDCVEFNRNYPNCQVDYPYDIGDGECDGDDYNTAECGWDGGDCETEETSEPTPTEEPTDEGTYDSTAAGTPLNYPHCYVEYPDYVGDGFCDAWVDGVYNTEECGWDGGDCDEENAILWKSYPECNRGVDPETVGDGDCDGGEHNTAECGWDGGDCEEINRKYPNCEGRDSLNDGYCWESLNTAKCGWDGGDCLFDKYEEKECEGTVRITRSGKTHAWCQTKCIDDGNNCKAYDFTEYPWEMGVCRIFSSYSSKTNSLSRYACWKKK